LLKINVNDCYTFFRLHHELDEVSRKKDEFLKIKAKFFDKRDPEDLIKYDDELDKFDAIQNNSTQPKETKNFKDSKEYEFACRVAEKLKDGRKRKDSRFTGENIAFEFFSGLKDPRYRNDLI
jgi:hypothetical protein